MTLLVTFQHFLENSYPTLLILSYFLNESRGPSFDRSGGQMPPIPPRDHATEREPFAVNRNENRFERERRSHMTKDEVIAS